MKVLVTGAAVRIGAAIAESLAADGCEVVIHYHRSAKAADALRQKIEEKGGRASLVGYDLEQADAGEAIFAAIGGEPVSALVHNASLFERDDLAGFTPERFRRHQRIHVEALLELVRAFVSQLPKGKGGSVISLLDGMQGWSISGHFLSYALSKETLRASIPLLAANLAPHVRVNGVALAATLPGESDDEETFDRLARMTPLKRTGEIAEVCDTVRFLLDASGVTGQVVDLSGGMAIRFLTRDDAGGA